MKVRSIKEKVRIERFFDLINKVNYKGMKMKIIEFGEVLFFRMGDVIVEFDEVCFLFGNKMILNGFSYVFNKGEKIGFVGFNGVGKMMFIKIILG